MLTNSCAILSCECNFNIPPQCPIQNCNCEGDGTIILCYCVAVRVKPNCNGWEGEGLIWREGEK